MALVEETRLIHQAQTGNNKAFDALYRAHHAQIYNTVRTRANLNDVEDLVQITFIRAFERISAFRGASAFSTWLTRISLNVCNTHWRKHQQAQYVTLEKTDIIKDTETPDTHLQRAESYALIMKGIQHLPEKHRKAVWLHYIMDHSYEDITRILQVPSGTVKTWLNRGRQDLRIWLRRLGIHNPEMA
jgi:RNA polymerase sigma-70 factor (ECF subfamily)